MRRLSLAVVVCLCVLAGGVLLAPSAHAAPLLPSADACDPQPDWWNAPAWVAWIACEASLGTPASNGTSVVGVFSPVLNDVSSKLDALAGLPSAITSGVTGFFTPTDADFTPVMTAYTSIQVRQPFKLLGAVGTAVQRYVDYFTTLDAGLSGGGGAGPASLGDAVSSTSIGGATHAGAEQVYGGIEAFAFQLGQLGLPQSTLYAITDTFL